MAGGTLLRATILQALCTSYPTPKQVREAAVTLVNALAAAVSTQAFIAHTAEDLDDEEMEVTNPHSHHTQTCAYPFFSPH